MDNHVRDQRVIFSACYALTLYRRVSFGRIEHEGLQQIADTDRREIFFLCHWS